MSAVIDCPACGSSDIRPVLIGMPSPEAFEAAERGEVILAGCVIQDGAWPTHGCARCGLRWAGESATT